MRLINSYEFKQKLLNDRDLLVPKTVNNTFAQAVRYGFHRALRCMEQCTTIGAEPVNATDTNVGSKWIPVTERLPELIPCNAGTAYSEAVIVWTDGKKAMIAVWDGIDFLCAADYWEAWGEDITHWMPLPEPPKDGGAENDHREST